MMGQGLRYFIWGYQPHFAHHLGYTAAEMMSELGLGKVVARGSIVGVLAPGAVNANPVCVCPEDGFLDLADWAELPEQVERVFRGHAGQHLHYGDAARTEDKPENLRRDSVSKAVEAFLKPQSAANGLQVFVGLAARVADYYVAPVIEVEAAALSGEFALPGPIVFDQWTAAPSLAHSAISQLLSEATAELQRKDPGRYNGTRGLERTEMIRRAGEHFMHGPALAIRDLVGAASFFAMINQLSSLLYERRQGRGNMVLGRVGDPALTFDLRFARPVSLQNARWSRKLLEMGNPELAIIADATAVYGLGRRNGPDAETAAPAFEIEFLGQHRWWLKADGGVVMRCDYGVPSIPRRAVTSTDFARNFRRIFAASSQAEAERAAELFDEVERLDHGCMIVFSEDAVTEAGRLAGQGTPTAPLLMSPAVLRRVSGIDGTVLLDPSSTCHAVGVILDGPAHEDCDPARGSRYNSAVRYVRAEMSGRLAVVASDDGMINVIPILRPTIYRSRLRQMVEAIEAATKDNYHKVRTWLRDHSFYLDGGMCLRVNAALQRIAAEPRDLGEINLVETLFRPHPDLDASYFIEEEEAPPVSPEATS